MKKTALFILFLSAILLMSVACKDKNDPIVQEQESIETITYNLASKLFGIKYSNGKVIEIKATFDEKVSPPP